MDIPAGTAVRFEPGQSREVRLVPYGGARLGFIQTATENERACAAFPRELVERGLDATRGLLCVVDGVRSLDDHWRSSDQKQRWLIAALLDIEPRLRRIKGFHALPLLRQALLTEVQGEDGAKTIQAA